MVTSYTPKGDERAPKTFRLIVDGQQLNVIVEALRQFKNRHPEVIKNAQPNIRHLSDELTEALLDEGWNRQKQYDLST